MPILTSAQTQAIQPDPLPASTHDAHKRAKRAIESVGHWNPNQQFGSRWAAGCVALEITQRCNLDCTLCYLSEISESIQDLPLDEIYRRIELIRNHYGPDTDVQITGGDPTLRKEDELLAIVRRIRDSGMRATLMTNGKRARRPLLLKLAKAGLVDIAFHVDTTQQIPGYDNELELNAIRQRYIDRCKGLPLSVMFNTTIHAGNLDDIPELVRFFVANAPHLRTVSFQLQADSGRGSLRKRHTSITRQGVLEKIAAGTGTALNYDSVQAGHPQCNRYALSLVINGKVHNFFDDPHLIGELQSASRHINFSRRQPLLSGLRFTAWLLGKPRLLFKTLRWGSKRLYQMRHDLIQARGRITTLSFFMHNFMDACELDAERVQACVFKTMTSQGPISMCVHNARRDEFLLRPTPDIILPRPPARRPLTKPTRTTTKENEHANPVFE